MEVPITQTNVVDWPALDTSTAAVAVVDVAIVVAGRTKMEKIY